MSSICFDIPDQNCDTCFEYTYSVCFPTFAIPVEQTAETQYYAWLIAPDWNVYQSIAEITDLDPYDIATIDWEDSAYPVGLFNKYAGKFELFLTLEDDIEDTPIPIQIGGEEYNCILINWTTNCCEFT